MNKQFMRRQHSTIAVMAVVFLLSVSCGIWNYCRHENRKNYVGKAAILVSGQKDALGKGDFQKSGYPYLLVDEEGNVLYADEEFKKKAGQKVPVEEILSSSTCFLNAGMEQEYYVYRTVLTQGKEQRFLFFLIPYVQMNMGSKTEALYALLRTIIAGMLLVLLIKIGEMRYLRKKIRNPIVEITDSAKEIIYGNYDKEVVRVFDSRVRQSEIGELIFSFELMRDELKNKQIREEQLNRNQKELISCISHDLKTPISTIRAYAEGIRDGVAGTEEIQKEYLAIIIHKTNLLTDMIEELLEYSNACLRKLNIEKQEEYFETYYHQVMSELERYIKQRDALFEWEPIENDVLLKMDKKRITEVFYNLVENSMKYRSEKRRLKIRIFTVQRDNALEIHVKDNGMGILVQDIPFLFDKFYRGEKSRSLSVPGSGLGLSICKYIMEEHGGSISCRECEEGSEFVLTMML